MTFSLSPNDSARLDALRFPLIVLVIYIHARAATLTLKSTNAGLDPAALARIVIGDGVARTAVPLFFVLSGYFLFLGQSGWSWPVFGKKLKRRVRTLLVPYVFWNVLLFVVLSVAQVTTLRVFFNTDGILANMDFTTQMRWVLGFQRYPIAYQFWFLRDLIVLVLITPVLFFVARQAWSLMIFTGVLGALWITNIWPIEIPAIEALLFFFIGLSAGLHRRSLLSVPPLVPLVAIYAALMATVIAVQETIFADAAQRVLVATGILVALAIVRALPERSMRSVAALAGASFFVFAVHEPLTTTLLKLSFHFLPDAPLISLIIYLIVPIIVVGISLAAYALSVRLAPAFTRGVTGR